MAAPWWSLIPMLPLTTLGDRASVSGAPGLSVRLSALSVVPNTPKPSHTSPIQSSTLAAFCQQADKDVASCLESRLRRLASCPSYPWRGELACPLRARKGTCSVPPSFLVRGCARVGGDDVPQFASRAWCMIIGMEDTTPVRPLPDRMGNPVTDAKNSIVYDFFVGACVLCVV